MALLDGIFGPRNKLPRDQRQRIPRRIKRATKAEALAVKEAVDTLSGLDGIADITQANLTLPRGFTKAIETVFERYDAYIDRVADLMGVADAPRAGTPEGQNACYEAPMGVSAVESFHIYRTIRSWKDFPRVGQSMGEQAQSLMDAIQSRHQGKDPEKIRMGGKAVGEGRLTIIKEGKCCPLLDKSSGRCRVWDQRPAVCRMHYLRSDPEWSDPNHERFEDVDAANIRWPLQAQVGLTQLDKRLNLQLSPFMFVSTLQLLEMSEGDMILEVGETPRKMGEDGRVAQRANRKKKSAKKYKKKGKGKKRK